MRPNRSRTAVFPQAQTAHDNFWDFISLTPESIHMALWIMSDRAIPRSFRFMEGFGVHTFRLVNRAGKSTFVKFHWKPKLGMQSVVWNEAVKINGADPDFHRRDLWNAIQSGQFPEWELGLQLFDDKFADRFEFDILDATKIIPEDDVPIRRAVRLVLDRCVDNFFAETEQVAFCTQNIVPGIDFTNDPLLQGRNFSYLDTQLKRLGGPNFTRIPVNAPKCPVNTFQQDGHMAILNPRGRANYEPNSWGDQIGGPRESPESGFQSFPAEESGPKVRIRAEKFADHYSQARQFYISQTVVEQEHIAAAFTFELSKVEKTEIRSRMVSHLLNVNQELAQKVAGALGLRELPPPAEAARPTLTELKPSPALSILRNGPERFEAASLACL
jgi:catalase